MSLTKKEIKRYKPLIHAKLSEMGVKDEVGYTQTGSSRMRPQVVQGENGPQVEQVKSPNYRAANLYKSLTKKLLNTSPKAVERFLETIIPKKEEESVLINKEVTGESEATTTT